MYKSIVPTGWIYYVQIEYLINNECRMETKHHNRHPFVLCFVLLFSCPDNKQAHMHILTRLYDTFTPYTFIFIKKNSNHGECHSSIQYNYYTYNWDCLALYYGHIGFIHAYELYVLIWNFARQNSHQFKTIIIFAILLFSQSDVCVCALWTGVRIMWHHSTTPLILLQ